MVNKTSLKWGKREARPTRLDETKKKITNESKEIIEEKRLFGCTEWKRGTR